MVAGGILKRAPVTENRITWKIVKPIVTIGFTAFRAILGSGQYRERSELVIDQHAMLPNKVI